MKTNQTIFKVPIENILIYGTVIYRNIMIPIYDTNWHKQNIFEIPIESKQNFKIFKDTNWKYLDTNLKCLVNLKPIENDTFYVFDTNWKYIL